ncbi:hypothetical protein GCM10027168_45040 [Streptomyces capparidis]
MDRAVAEHCAPTERGSGWWTADFTTLHPPGHDTDAAVTRLLPGAGTRYQRAVLAAAVLKVRLGLARRARRPTTPVVPGEATEHAPAGRPPSGPARQPHDDYDRGEDSDLAAVEDTRQRLAALTTDTNRRIRQHHAARNPPTAPTPPAAPGRGEQPPTYPAPPTPPTGRTV